MYLEEQHDLSEESVGQLRGTLFDGTSVRHETQDSEFGEGNQQHGADD